MALQISDRIVSEMQVSGPSTEEEIREAERELGVQFPPEYREFLTKYNSAMGIILRG